MTLYHYSTCVLLHHCPLHGHLTPTTGCGKCRAISCEKSVWIGKVTCLWYTCKIVAILSSVCIYSCSLLIPKWSVSDMGLGLTDSQIVNLDLPIRYLMSLQWKSLPTWGTVLRHYRFTWISVTMRVHLDCSFCTVSGTTELRLHGCPT